MSTSMPYNIFSILQKKIVKSRFSDAFSPSQDFGIENKCDRRKAVVANISKPALVLPKVEPKITIDAQNREKALPEILRRHAIYKYLHLQSESRKRLAHKAILRPLLFLNSPRRKSTIEDNPQFPSHVKPLGAELLSFATTEVGQRERGEKTTEAFPKYEFLRRFSKTGRSGLGMPPQLIHRQKSSVQDNRLQATKTLPTKENKTRANKTNNQLSSANIKKIADKIYRIIEKRIAIEKDRRGIF